MPQFYSNSVLVRRLFDDSDSEEDSEFTLPTLHQASSEPDIYPPPSVRRRLNFEDEDEDEDENGMDEDEDGDEDEDEDEDEDSPQRVTLTSSQEGRLKLFNHSMFQEWNRPCSGQIDIPVLIMDIDGLRRNKDLDALPRFFMTQMRATNGNCHIPFTFMEDSDGFETLNHFIEQLGLGSKKAPGCAKFREAIESKPKFEELMPFYESVNIFLYCTFLLKQFAPIFGYIPQFYSPISDDAKYYFYIFFDYLRRKAIRRGTLLRKRVIVELVRDIGRLDGLCLSPERIVQCVGGIDHDLFDHEGFQLLTASEPFSISA